ncbi:MAG: transposase [Betaproteobacteria bacterium]
MTHCRRINQAGATYFFTLVTYRRRAFLCNQDVLKALRDAIDKTRAQYPFTIDAWVILPDHMHAIWTLPPDDADFANRWRLIKRYVTLACGVTLYQPNLMTASKTKHRESTLWQRRYWEHLIRDDDDYAKHMDYVHFNPVKHGLVNRVLDWPHSSFHRHARNGIYAQDWGLSATEIEENFGE